MKKDLFFPAEWEPQSAVQLAWPHEESDWAPYLEEASACLARIAREIASRERLIITAPDIAIPREACRDFDGGRIVYREVPSNDTWCRDFGGLTVFAGGIPRILDFRFNGWGLKFPADRDNLITGALYRSGLFSKKAEYANRLNFVLEGGSVESDGEGTLLTTGSCLLSPNRNGGYNKEQIEEKLLEYFGADRVLWLDQGYLAGDDTDSHIDTLARFCDGNTICYVECDDPGDEHFESLGAMKEQLESFRKRDGSPYRLVALPMAEPLYFEGERLPATYANFLIINGAVLVPVYGTSRDAAALETVASLFPGREVRGIDCAVLARQHGSLHCVTMQYPKGVFDE